MMGFLAAKPFAVSLLEFSSRTNEMFFFQCTNLQVYCTVNLFSYSYQSDLGQNKVQTTITGY